MKEEIGLCKRCGKELPIGCKFCPYCGTRVEEKFRNRKEIEGMLSLCKEILSQIEPNPVILSEYLTIEMTARWIMGDMNKSPYSFLEEMVKKQNK